MRRAVSVIAMAAIVAACGSAAAPSAATPSASSGVVAGSAAAPTMVPGAVTAPPAVDGALELTASNIDFEPKALTAPAGPVAIDFHNRDNGVPHNIEVKDVAGTSVYRGEILAGPSDTEEWVGDLGPGVYTFLCTVHPNMQGTLTVLP